MNEMNELAKQVKEVYHDIVVLWETDNVISANNLLQEGARLLGISINTPDADTAAVYIIGWPKDNGDIPIQIKRYGI